MVGRERRFSVHDLLVALLRDQNIHDGFWGLTVQFEAEGAAVPIAGKPGENLPGLAVAVSGVTLTPATEGENGAVDASLVNPPRPAPVRNRAKVKTLQ
ncbi:hypothetical protein AO069_03490 [Pseudomonas syringae pv. syringae PD2774]|uniref:Uncharacterized protein n=1 Tax=Pseudomonas syringae pv. spinaceae TaxID=264459 RepID=A0A0Q0BIM0_PSESX|nr:Uncharacterized protein ALO94_01909 [Pseudomonas syringae pv. spinaceae]KTB78494.1 hypothetical protein AO069_03490 [Pseudomonas syringae pv. syringae PD2774]KWS15098.1 hypothetical protein AL064_04570 [Pseudomonas syringae pv. syringae]PPS37258.1 hypothetical protein B0F86_25865 [Pseudomonas syringae]KWS23046.1 hypothetical protein AL061_22670 [Pseudomonas syringae pv. syringae]